MVEWLSPRSKYKYGYPVVRLEKNKKMFFVPILIIFTFVSTATTECETHDKKYSYHERYYLKYRDITDLGLAAIHNHVDSVEDLVMKVWVQNSLNRTN